MTFVSLKTSRSAGPQQRRQISKLPVLVGSREAFERQQPAGGTLGGRLLRDELLG